VQDIAEPSVTITVNNQKHVDFQFTSQDLTLTVEEFNSRYLKPGMAALANQVDFDVLGNWSGVSNYVGTPLLPRRRSPRAFNWSVVGWTILLRPKTGVAWSSTRRLTGRSLVVSLDRSSCRLRRTPL
jgi:hypothetical protein